jgi:AcrR family transcriptional regulator
MTPSRATATAVVDKPAAVRAALRTLVARKGFHGASMSAVAAEAGVATGTAYVHYASKEELVFAAYLEAKRELGEAAVVDVDPTAPARVRFHELWLGIHRHLRADPDRARFLMQVDSSPYARAAHEMAMAADGDPIMLAAVAPDLMMQLVDLPLELLYDLGLAPAVRLAASDLELDPAALDRLADACWRAITRPV